MHPHVTKTSDPQNCFRGVGCSERIATFAELRCGRLLHLDSLLWYIYKSPVRDRLDGMLLKIEVSMQPPH
jgi:hypothetical protein